MEHLQKLVIDWSIDQISIYCKESKFYRPSSLHIKLGVKNKDLKKNCSKLVGVALGTITNPTFYLLKSIDFFCLHIVLCVKVSKGLTPEMIQRPGLLPGCGFSILLGFQCIFYSTIQAF